MGEAKQKQAEMNAAMKVAVDVHQRLADLAKQMVAEGIDPGIIGHAMLTTGTDVLIQAYGREHAMRGLLECYGPIRAAVVQDATGPAPTRQ